MLFLHEVHEVVGSKEDDFEAAYRDRSEKEDDDARVVFYATQAHGAGPSYRVVTLTAIEDGDAWLRLAHRVQRGDLQAWATEMDRLRHDVTGKLFLPLPWSPTAPLERGPVDHDPVLYMEDTMWPFPGKLNDYLAAAGTHYSALLQRPESLLQIILAARPALGAGPRPEVCLLQRVKDPARVLDLLATPIAPERRQPGTWMHDALTLRDQWRSRLLRTSRWSPW